MKRLLLFIISFFALQAYADSRSADLLTRLSSKVESYGNYEVNFSVAVQGQRELIEGYYVVSGDRYAIEVDDKRVFSDGRVRYEIDNDYEEVVISRANPASRNILENPAKAFSFLDGNFESVYVGAERFDGVACDIISLKPLSREFGITEITLYIDSSATLPRGIRYRIDNSSITVTVKRFERLAALRESVFAFDRQEYRGYEIIDFR